MSLSILNKVLTRAKPVLFDSWAPFVVLTLALTAFVTFWGWISYDEQTRTAQNQVKNITHLLCDQLNHPLYEISHSFDFIVAQIKPEAMVAESKSRYQNEITTLLEEQVKLISLPVVTRIFDAKGDLIYSAVPNEASINVSHREYFTYLRHHPGETYFSPTALIGNLSGAHVIPIARAIRSSSGAFIGVVLTTIPINSLKHVFQHIGVGSGGTILFRAIVNGSLIYRYPDNGEQINHQLPNTPMEKMIASGIKEGETTYTPLSDGVKRLYGYKVLDTPFPYFIAVGLAQSDYLASWRKGMIFTIFGAFVLNALVGFYFFRQRRAYKSLVVSSEMLRSNEDKLRGLFELSPIGIARTDMSGRFVEFNEAFRAITGFNNEELLSLGYWQLTPKKYEASEALQLKSIEETGRFGPYEKTYINKNGVEVPVQLSGMLIKGADEENYIWSIIEDITLRKQNRSRLDLLATCMAHTNDVVVITEAEPVDLPGPRIIYVNDAFVRMTGYAVEEAIGNSPRMLQGPKSDRVVLDRIRDALLHWQPVRAELINYTKDGHEFIVELDISPIADADGWYTHWIAIQRDITERKLAERVLLDAKNSLEQSQERLTLATTAGGVGIWEWDIVNDILVWDAQMYRLYGIGGDQFSGAYAAWQAGVHPDDRERTDLEIQNVLAGHKEYDVKYRVVWPDGSIHYIHALGYVERDGSDKPIRMSGTNWDITEQKLLEQRAEELAFFDPLTSLPNRRLFADRLQRAIILSERSKQYCALLAIDIDNFKNINDLHGHDGGDLVLQATAQHLLNKVRSGDTVARMGGDEFMILLEDLGSNPLQASSVVKTVAEKILAKFNAFDTLTSSIPMRSLSIGITTFMGQSIDSVAIIKQSDIALYQAKESGRNCIKFYDEQMQAVINERFSMENALHQAIKNDWFILHYQPQMDSNQRIESAEVLLRLDHPQHGLMNPGEFIGLAESTGLILPIGQWVFNATCQQLAAWATQDSMAHLALSVNISIKQFQQANFVSQMIDTVVRTGANPKLITLELTESLFLDGMADAKQKMQALKDYGFNFSLDDFGTGYSSLSYLKSLPFDELKIDQAFIAETPGNQVNNDIVRTIILMGQTLGLKVVAEGVESKDQLEYLKALGCHHYQGYLFFHPMPLDDFMASITH